MATSIEKNKKSVKDYLESGKDQKFVIPEYQRPYAWTDEEVLTLFEDLVEYTEENIDSPYFLGSIVSYTNEFNEQEVIDGQQRITTLFLLLRAIYSKLEKMTDSKEKKYAIGKIEPTLWKTEKLTGEAIKDQVLIESRVYESNFNKVLTDILETGKTEKGSKDGYTQNYLLCQKLIDDYAKDEPISFYPFVNNILENVIVLPIKADNQDTALTIFSTLNDRGLPLSDADIFKAKIYNSLKDPDERNQFIKKWQELSTNAEYANESIQKLFYYYMFYLRADENDRKSTTPGLRKYFASNSFHRLYEQDLMNNLNTILNFWTTVNNHEAIYNGLVFSDSPIRWILDSYKK